MALTFWLASVFFFLQVNAPEIHIESTDQERVTETISQLRQKAEAGDVSCQVRLAAAYKEGAGVPKNEANAAKWYRRAAESGNAEAQNSLGVLLWTGHGVEQDREEAVRWYREAARIGNPAGMFNLGVAYYNGDGVPMDDTLAAAWFLLAANAGKPEAQAAVERFKDEKHPFGISAVEAKIGELYEAGDGLPKDRVQALSWYRKASDDGSAMGGVRAAMLLLDEKPEAPQYKEILERCRAATRNKYPPALFCVGYLYRNGLGVAKQPDEAIKSFRDAAAYGHKGSIGALVDMYLHGDGIPIDRAQAYYWLYSSAFVGVPGSKKVAMQLWQQMSKEERSAADKQFKRHLLDKNKVHEFMSSPEEPAVESPTQQLQGSQNIPMEHP